MLHRTWPLLLCLLIARSAAAQPAEPVPGQGGMPVLQPIEKGFPTAPPPPPAPEPAPAPAPEAVPEPVPAPVPEAVSVAETVPESEPAPVAGPVRGVRAPRPPDPFAPREPARVRYASGEGFQLLTDDGDFALGLQLWGQVRYGYHSVVGEDRQSLLIKRARAVFKGHFFGQHYRYFLNLGFSPDDMKLGPAPVVGLPDPAVDGRGGAADQATDVDVLQQSPLLDLHFDFTHLRDLSLRAGQFRLPFTRQRMIGDVARQLHERALADQEFQLDRDVGVMLYSNDLGGADMLRYSAGVFIGEGRNPGSGSIGAGDRGFLYLARFELLPVGRFDVSSETDFTRASEARIALGAAYALLQADATSPHAVRFLGRTLGGAEETAIVDFNAHNLTGDVLLKAAGVSAQGAVHFRTFDGAVGARRGLGFLLSAGYLLPRAPVEPVVRYSLVRGTGVTRLPDIDQLDLAINYFLARNQLRLSIQYGHRWGDAGFDKGDDILELQLQAGL